MTMRMLSKTKLKATMLEVFREIEASGEGIIVTDHNKPVLQVLPLKPRLTVAEAFSPYQGKVFIPNDIMDSETEDWAEI